MKPLSKKLKVDNRVEFFKKHIQIVNFVFETNLIKKEIEVLANFLALDDKATRGDIFNTYAKKIIKSRLNISSSGLSNYLGDLTAKGFLKKEIDTGRLEVNKNILPTSDLSQSYNIEIYYEEI